MAGIGDDIEFQAPRDGPPPPDGSAPGGPSVIWIALVGVAVIALAAGAYWFFANRTPPAVTAARPAATAPAPAPAATADDFEHIDLPPLDDSDALVRQRVGILSSNRLVTAWLATKGLVRNFVVVIDNISRGMNPSRRLAVLKPPGQFRVMTKGSQVVIDPRNYDRFAPIADAAASIDARSAGRLYGSFKPLLQTAYDELGSQERLDQAVERAISGLLAVPAIDGDVRVEQTGEGIGYQYSDDRLQELNGAQKQLLRMGPRNIRTIQAQLRTFAAAIGLRASGAN
ncbi:MAG TPA: DUF3014 domain-containing protein [Vicinamibacterales bacterium]|jgi:hypothetical protein|nr:DUF3014 domain-containing protein [Vicinamibacterales bacterium]